MIGPTPTLKPGRFYKLPDGDIVEVLSVRDTSTTVRSVRSRKRWEICSTSSLIEIDLKVATKEKKMTQKSKKAGNGKSKSVRAKVMGKYSGTSVAHWYAINTDATPEEILPSITALDGPAISLGLVRTIHTKMNAGETFGYVAEPNKTESGQLKAKAKAIRRELKSSNGKAKAGQKKNGNGKTRKPAAKTKRSGKIDSRTGRLIKSNGAKKTARAS